jgi:hypothetical protein
LLHIASHMAPIREVMYVQILLAPAGLASPVVPFEDLPLKYRIALWGKLHSRPSELKGVHEAPGAIWERNSCFCRLGKNR